MSFSVSFCPSLQATRSQATPQTPPARFLAPPFIRSTLFSIFPPVAVTEGLAAVPQLPLSSRPLAFLKAFSRAIRRFLSLQYLCDIRPVPGSLPCFRLSWQHPLYRYLSLFQLSTTGQKKKKIGGLEQQALLSGTLSGILRQHSWAVGLGVSRSCSQTVTEVTPKVALFTSVVAPVIMDKKC